MKVLYLINIPSPYRVDYFNELGKHCDLTVLFEKNTSDERDSSWLNYRFENFKGVFLKGKSYKTDGALCFSVIKYLKSGIYDHIVCANFTSLTGMLAIEYMRFKKIDYYLESDGGFPKNGKGFVERLKKHYIKDAKGYFSTGAIHDDYYLAYGAEKERIYHYPFTSVKDEELLENIPELEIKSNLREELMITEQFVVLSIGQFVHRKGIDVLIRSASHLPKEVGIYIVGGEPSEEYLSLVGELNLSNIHFVGFKTKEELKKYYGAADVFALLTREDVWGLVINEAMAMGLPIITTNRCIAGTELVKEGVNGYIIPTDDEKTAAEKINRIIVDQNANNFGKASLEIISNYTIISMSKAHIDVFLNR